MIPVPLTVCFRLQTEEVEPFLVGVCNYDVEVTDEKAKGLLGELEGLFKRIMYRYDHNSCMYQMKEKYLEIVLPFIPNAFEGKIAPPITTRIPKDINYAINGCMKETHEVLYPLRSKV
jgi:hypothetical protein